MMWMAYAMAAAVLWGVSYAACGRTIERGMSPLVFFFLYTAFGALAAGLWLVSTGELGTVAREVRALGTDRVWLAVSIISSAIGALVIYMAIGEKNATLASLIEISYPFFVAVFAWLFFRDTQINLSTALGGLMILGGVAVVFVANRG
jgi:drug/metabolite transporter (DMT)-like permease